MFVFIRNLIGNESGATAVEYGLIVALVSVAAIVALTSLGVSLSDIFGTVSTELTQAATAAGGS